MGPSRRRSRRQEPEPEPESEPELEQEQEESSDHEAEGSQDAEKEEGPGEKDLPGEMAKLQFDEPLTWRPGKPIPISELLPRLQRLLEQLGEMDQEAADKDSLLDVAGALSQRNLIQHKDSGIRAFTAACLVEILRICAPDAPFTEDQLKMIFSLFIRDILSSLQDPNHVYHSQHKYVLFSLSEVKSILLLNDLDGADDLFLRLFSTCFDSLSAFASLSTDGEVPKDVEHHLTQVITILIDESPGLPAAVVDTFMAQFLRAVPPGGPQSRAERAEQNGSQSTLLLKKEPPAYIMAKTICNSCPDKMARYVSQYFSDVIMDASSFVTKSNGHKASDGADDEEAGPSEADLKSLAKAHLLIKELWRAEPLVLQNVVPQVEAELSADNVHLRQIATETLGDMISGIGAAGPPPPPTLDPCAYPPLRLVDEPQSQAASSILTTPMSTQSFAQTHPAAYQSFIGRRNDKSAAIRAAWTTSIGYILATSAGGIGLSREEQSQLVQALGEKLNDSDEKVRLAGVKAIELFSFRDIVTKLGPNGGVQKEGSVLASLADRCRDKRPAVRVEAMVVLGRLWSVAAGELAAGQEAVTSCLSGIPTRILNAFYANDLDLNLLLDRVIFECLVPLGFPPRKGKGTKGSAAASSQSQTTTVQYDPDRVRAERVLQLAQSLDNPAKKAFFAMQGRQPPFANVLGTFIKQCEAYNGGTMDENEEVTTANLNKTIQYIAQFFPDKQKVLSDLQRFAKMNDRRNYQLVKFAIGSDNDFKTVHGAIKELVKRVQASHTPTILDTLIPLMHRSACIMFNRSHLSTIMDYSKSDKDGLGAVSHEILGEISQRNPAIFKTHVGDLCKSLIEQAPSDRKENDGSVVDILKACSSYSRKYPSEIPQDKQFIQTLHSYAAFGKPAKASKYAVNIMLAQKGDKSMVSATSLLQKIMKSWTYDSPHLLNNLASVSQLELLAPKVTMDYDDEILDLAVQKILLRVRKEASNRDPTWAEDADMDTELQAKCLSLKILVNRLRAIVDADEAKDKAKPVFKLLRTMVMKDGEICKTSDTPKHHRSRLLLRASQLMLKLCQTKHFDDMLQPADFNQLALVAQRGEPAVRHRFLEKLQKYLAQGKLRSRFYTIIFLTAFEPAAAFKQRIETWIRSRSRAFAGTDQHVMEATMGRLLSLLAHHPDYSTDLDNLVDHAKYILYYISNVASESNLGLIYKYAERVKQTRDGINPAQSENLYVLSDLAQAVIRKWQEKRNWSFQAFPGKVGLPIGLYTALPSHDVAQEIAQKQYIPDGIDDKLDELMRSIDRRKKRKSFDEGIEPPLKKLKAPANLAPREKPKEKTKAAKPPVKAKTPSKPKKPKPSAAPRTSAERRRSGRATKTSTYAERDSSEDDQEMLEGVAKWSYLGKAEKRPAAEEAVEAGDDTEPDEAVSSPEEMSDAEASPPPRRRTAKAKPPPKPAAPKPKAKATTTRAKKSKAAQDVYDMDMDEDD